MASNQLRFSRPKEANPGLSAVNAATAASVVIIAENVVATATGAVVTVVLATVGAIVAAAEAIATVEWIADPSVEEIVGPTVDLIGIAIAATAASTAPSGANHAIVAVSNGANAVIAVIAEVTVASTAASEANPATAAEKSAAIVASAVIAGTVENRATVEAIASGANHVTGGTIVAIGAAGAASAKTEPKSARITAASVANQVSATGSRINRTKTCSQVTVLS